ncbi:MAG TPA: glycosyltransferase family 9 protein, partial [Bacteroidia bacterium]
AFIGDVILATAVLEKLHTHYPGAQIDLLIRNGSESLFSGHPFLHELLVLDKRKGKYKEIQRLIKKVRETKYFQVINLHRFASSGLITAFSGAQRRVGFDKNPFSFSYTKKLKHVIGDGTHETERNQKLIAELTDTVPARPRLYPSEKDIAAAKGSQPAGKYICIAPASVWYTKQLPKEKWNELIASLDPALSILLLGAPGDAALCENIAKENPGRKIQNLAGKLSLLGSAELMRDAEMNYVNDSAPLHLATAVNAPVTAFFCSTVPAFGFGPLSDNTVIAEVKLECRPCGLHGHRSCPKGHFHCALKMEMKNYAVR